MKFFWFYPGLLLFSLVLSYGCQSPQDGASLSTEEVTEKLQELLITAEAGTTITLPEGEFNFKRPLSFNDTPDVTIKGAGKGKTVLSFADQVEGGEGFIVKSAKGITLEGFTVRDSKGDAIKVQDSENVTLRDLEVTWTNELNSSNGAYGLYPVTCTNVLMEQCEASNAMDAGIYVGQCKNVVVRNNYAHHNVAGIEIENTINAEVYENKAENNTGGLMIFDMPDLPQVNGYNIKVHDNEVFNNNGKNFSAPGMVVNSLSPGTGMLLMAIRKVEAYNNIITGHHTVSIAISSWRSVGLPVKSQVYDPYCHDIHIHHNTIALGSGPSDQSTPFGQLFSQLGQGQPLGFFTDGDFNPEHLEKNGMLKEEYAVCFNANDGVPFINLNALKADGMTEYGLNMEKILPHISTDIEPFNCDKKSLFLQGHDDWLAVK